MMMLIIVICIILFFGIIMPLFETNNTVKIKSIYERLNNIIRYDLEKCSKNCCNVQWQGSPELLGDDNNGKLNSNYVSSNMSCNFGKNSGCVCLSKDNFNYLENHGNNKSKCLNN
jgi:hypothetical protein